MGKRADEATVKYAHSLRDELRKVSTVILDEKTMVEPSKLKLLRKLFGS